jgi:hypothetical protein
LRYVSSRIDQKLHDDIYRFYVTNALKILTTNTAKFAGGTELTKTYREIISNDTTQSEEQQEKEAQDIIKNMKAKIAKARR